MKAPHDRWIRIVVSAAESQGSGNREADIQLPPSASIVDLLEELKATSSPLYEDVRKRVLRLSGEVLAFGQERPALLNLRDQLASGGPVIVPDTPPRAPF